MNDKPTLRPAQADEIALLHAIDHTARPRYAGLPGFDYAATSAPIGAERLASDETIVAELGGTLVGLCPLTSAL